MHPFILLEVVPLLHYLLDHGHPHLFLEMELFHVEGSPHVKEVDMVPFILGEVLLLHLFDWYLFIRGETVGEDDDPFSLSFLLGSSK
ncbi:MAG: hypothetical protein JXA22_00045 [Candidatus Thermoplasmatota archaeon]|nr:hypothetical protein [Candidatus Thermoplasmatota archaeon]